MLERTNEFINVTFSNMQNILSLYEITKGYSCLPDDEAGDIDSYMESAFSNMTSSINHILNIENQNIVDGYKIYRELYAIENDLKNFVFDWESPGVAVNWETINPNLKFYNCNEELLQATEKTHWVKTLPSGIRYGLTHEILELRRMHYSFIMEKQSSESRSILNIGTFCEELTNTLRLIFEEKFQV